MTEIYIGRQPLFNSKIEVIGYELLYRSYYSDYARFTDEDQATMRVILNTFAEIGFDNLVGDKIAYINVTRNFLTGKYPIPFPAERVVLEVLENIPVDAQLIEALSRLKRSGYRIALDDVTSIERVLPLLKFTNIAKIDLRLVNRQKLPDLVMAYKNRGVRVLAEKVETQEEFELCKSLGFDYFQGYFLCKPSTIRSRHLDSSRMVILRSIARLQDPKISFQDLEEVVTQDVSISYKLLKLVNSAYYSLSSPVKSISQAISYIGLDPLRGWMTLLLLSSIVDKPHELTTIALIRAKMCEQFARASGETIVDSYSLVGLFSVLDAYMDLPMYEVIYGLPLSTEITDALLYRSGSHGHVLDMVMAYERGDWDKVRKLPFNPEKTRQMFSQSILWASTMFNSIYSTGIQ
jgi:EAL and modified HD-GYP domain-containing signal transduction protein